MLPLRPDAPSPFPWSGAFKAGCLSVALCLIGPVPVGPSPVGPSPVGPSPVGPSPVCAAPGPSRPTPPLTVFVAGDVLLGRGVAPFLRRPTGATSLEKWRSHSTGADIAFCNLECALTPTPRAIPTRLVADTSLASSLKDAGFDIVSTANNHALDAGSRVVPETLRALKALGIAAVGSRLVESRETPWPAYETTVRGRSLAFVAASAWGPFSSGAAHVRPVAGSGLIKQVQRLAVRSLVFVSLHWGIEHTAQPTAAQRQLAHRLIEAGALAVIGHHPHVVQEVETYRGRPIFYSLGNFLFDHMPRPQSGLAATLSIDEARRVKVDSFAVQPVPQPVPQPAKLAQTAQSVRKLGNAGALLSIARWLVPRGERVRKAIGARLLVNSPSSQLVVWSQAPSGHRLRAYGKDGERWRLVAQGRHAFIFDLQCGPLTGQGGVQQIVLGLRQRSKLDVKVRNRLHVYALRPQGGFRPLWRGSALSRPFRAFVLLPNPSGHCDLVALEKNPLPAYREFDWITVYRWNDFGFRAFWDTPVRGTVADLRVARETSETGPPRYVIRFEQQREKTRRTLTLRAVTQGNGTTEFKASTEP